MKKRFLLWAIILTLTGAGAVFIRLKVIHLNEDRAKNKALADEPLSARQIAEAARARYGSQATTTAPLLPLDLNRPVRLALGSLGLADDNQNERLSDLVLAKLAGAEGLVLVERQSLQAVLRELNMSWSGLVRARDALRAGKLLQADWFLLGTRTKINGTNSIVIRLVDARTGVLRDAGVFSSDEPLERVAEDIAAFARQSRQNAASVKSPVFLAIGAFKDFSVNNRQSEFPTQLRGYLAAAFRGGKVTLLEREYVETLLQEVHLDMAGLTAESATNTSAPLLPAYWLVDGCYQSFETTNREVEVTLDVQRIFGLTREVTLRGLPGDPVNRQIKQMIDRLMNQNQGPVIPTRMSEIRAQMSMGRELSQFNAKTDIDFVFAGPSDWQYLDGLGNRALRKRNLEEAIRCFETVLLLDPENREARMYLATCLRDPLIQRAGNARQYYSELIDASVQDRWTGMAQRALTASFATRFGQVTDAGEKARWFESAAQHAVQPTAKSFYAQEAKGASQVENEAAIRQGGGAPAEALAEQRLFEALQSYQGSSDFSAGEIRNWPQFVNKLKRHSDPVSDFLWQSLPASNQAVLNENIVVHALNQAIEGPPIYQRERFRGIHLRPETAKKLRQPGPAGLNLVRLNRMLLEDAYPAELSGVSFEKDIGNHGSEAIFKILEPFVKTFGDDHAAAARRLAELLPKVKSRIPELEPYFLSAIVTFQTDTNAPVVAELQQELAHLDQHPTEVLAPEQFWNHLRPVCHWSFEHKLYGLAAWAMEGEVRASAEGCSFMDDDQQAKEDQIALAYAYRGLEQWQQARQIFEIFSNQPCVMNYPGPWPCVVLTGKEAALCAEKLGQTPARDSREFDMGRACLNLCPPSVFLADESGLWIGTEDRLLRLDFDLKTNLAVALPTGNEAALCCLCTTASTVWLGTDGGGLIEYDKSIRECRRLTEKDGLLMNKIACLNLVGGSLWIGYGSRTLNGDGGVGRLDLSTRRFESFTPPLGGRQMPLFGGEPATQPPRRVVLAMAGGADDDLWFVSQNGGTHLRRFRTHDKVWEAVPQYPGILAADQRCLFIGQSANYFHEDKGALLGVSILDFKENKWRSVQAADGLPSLAVTAMVPTGRGLWVGGTGYIALVDLEQNSVRKFARIQATSVDQIQIGGGCLWAQYDCHLHRAWLENIQ